MMIEMKERMTCLNSILADREAPFTLEYCQRWKNNCMLEAYQLVNPKKNCSPTIFYGAWYEDDDESVADFLMKLFEENSVSLDVSPYVSPEFILDNILPRMVYKDNLPEIQKQNLAYTEYLDLIVLFYLPVEIDALKQNKDPNGQFSIQVSQSVLERAGVSLSEAYEHAVENVKKKTEIIPMWKMLEETGYPIDLRELNIQLLVVTIDSSHYGAGTLVNSEVLREVSEKIGGDYVVLPSSIHEWIAHPYHEDELPMYKAMVEDVNRTEVSLEERLSNSIYHYDAARGSLDTIPTPFRLQVRFESTKPNLQFGLPLPISQGSAPNPIFLPYNMLYYTITYYRAKKPAPKRIDAGPPAKFF